MKRSFKAYLIFLLFVFPVFCLNHTVKAVEEDELLLPEADTYVKSTDPTLNFGGDEYLEVSNSTSLNGIKVSYLIFDVSEINKDILSIFFHIRTTSIVYATQEVGLFTISKTNWNEYELTFDNQPTEMWEYVDNQTVAVANEWYQWSIPLDRIVDNRTCIVLNILEETDSYVDIWFRSRETDIYFEDYRPHIHVVFEVETTKLSGYTLVIVLISISLAIPVIKNNTKRLSLL